MVQQNNRKKRDNSLLFKRALLTGFVGGLFWSVIGMFLYYFNFIEVSSKAFILKSWTKAEWTSGWIGSIITVFLVGIVSIGVAIIYYLLFKKFSSMWAGVIYGIVLWFIVFYFFNSLVDHIPSLGELSRETIISSVTLYILYGTFIGYSISFDYNGTIVDIRKG